MINIKIITTGKIKESWLISAIQEYEKRLSKMAKFSWVILKNDQELEKEILKEKKYFCLDVNGKVVSSPDLSKIIFNFLEKEGSNLTFVIGGPLGLSDMVKNKSYIKISLSMLTFTHQMARLILIEQIYRSFEIFKQSSYHK